MVAEEAEHVRKLNKKTEETCERETYYLLTKKEDVKEEESRMQIKRLSRY